MHRKNLVTVLLLTVVIIAANAQNQWPTNGWLTTTPEMVGLKADSVTSLNNELASGKYGYIDGMLIIRHGKIAYEKSYQHNYADIYKKEANEKSALNNADPSGPYNY